MKISTTITKRFFEMKMDDMRESGYFFEFEELKPFWNKRLNIHKCNRDVLNIEIVFLVGSKPFRFVAKSIWEVHRDFIPEKYRCKIKTEHAYAIKCFPIP